MPLAMWPPEFLERAQEMVIWLSVLVAMVVAQVMADAKASL